MAVDPGLMMALSVHAHKGVYAVLLGSGVSRSAGIPTGWDVVKNLIERLAIVRGISKVEDAEAWYRKEFGREPNYSDLVEMLAPTPPERMSLLKEFFEPTEKERDEGLKVPTAAHRAIARLVARGYIRVIVTTNFDKLTERAIEAEGVTPTIVSSADGIAGMMPLPHVRCLVVKVHGDYLDTRIRNTPAELAAYDAETNALLDRIFSEYGLIVCGWSGEWDPALAEAIRRSTRHRFSTYWMLRGKLSDRAAELVSHRQAALIPIETADKAFADLDARVEALEAQRVADPMSPRIALAMTKRFLSEHRFRIQLQDLVVGELNGVRKQLTTEAFPLGQPRPDEQSYRARVERYEAVCANLAPMVAACVYWGDQEFGRLWCRCVESLGRLPFQQGACYDVWDHLRLYPANLIAYAAGLAAIQRGRMDWLKMLLYDTTVSKEHQTPQPVGAVIGSTCCIAHQEGQYLHKRDPNTTLKTPGSDWMVARLAPMLADVWGEDLDFETAFDDFEFLLSLVRFDLAGYTLPGRFCWRGASLRDQLKQVESIDSEVKAKGDQHPLLLAGMFAGKVDRLTKAVAAVGDMSGRVR
jgi:hypothetical protein